MNKKSIGFTKDNEEIFAYTLENSKGLKAVITDFGCNLMELWVPDKNGEVVDVALGFEKIEDYFTNGSGFGCAICPNGNRIGESKFTLEGVTYELEQNDGRNNLHSGFSPMHRRMWKVVEVTDTKILFTAHKADMDMGFPGEMDIKIGYEVTENNEIILTYSALSDKTTIFNPTNHTYFNLSGHDAGTITDHIVQLDCSTFTMADDESIPHGEITPVAGTPMDFTTPHAIGERINDTSYDPIKWGGGYDHNYVIDNPSLTKEFGSLYDPKSGRKMLMYTDLPGVQLYAGNFIGEPAGSGKGGVTYNKRDGVCFETQFYPNAINVPSFPQPLAPAGKEVGSTTIYKFINE